MAKTQNYQVAGDLDVSTTGNIDDLSLAGCAVIRMTNATLATIRGLAAGFPGQRVLIVSTGAGQVDLAHQNAGSTAANRLLNFATSASTSLAAGVGTAEYEYDGTTARWRLVDHRQGAYIDVPYAGGNFTANLGMTWTVDVGDQITFSYFLAERRLQVVGYFDTTSVTAPLGSLLQALIPGGFTSSTKMQGISLGFDNGVGTATYNRVQSGGTVIEIGRGDAANWSAAVNNTFPRIHFEFGVT